MQNNVYVIVNDSANAYIDQDGNGILNSADYVCGCSYEPANFGSGGNADLAENAVTIHFHDHTQGPIYFDLTGFTANDRIEIDMDAYFGRDFLHTRATQNIAKTAYSFGDSDYVYASTVAIGAKAPYGSAYISSATSNVLTWINVGLQPTGGAKTIAHFHDGYNPVSHGNVDFISSSSLIIIPDA